MNIEKTEFQNTELLLRLIENDVDDQEIEAIEKWFQSDPQANSTYLDFIKDYTAIKMYTESQLIPRQEVNVQLTKSFDYNVWQALAEMEISAPAVDIQEEEPERPLIQKVVYPELEKRKVTKSQIITLIMSAAAVLFFVLFIKFVPVKNGSVEVATLVDQIQVKWGHSSTSFENGSRLMNNGGLLELKEGIVKIHYDDDVDVLIEGPAVFEIERLGLFIEYGRLYSLVSTRGLGFTVKSPTTQFVDLGTEFGIQADIHGSTELHVTKGQVQLFARSKSGEKIYQSVSENEAVRFDVLSNRLSTVAVNPTGFVRRIDSKRQFAWKGQPLDLADVLGGGNGFGTGQIQYGVSLKSSVIEKIPYEQIASRGKEFVQVESLFVDRFFKPLSGTSVQVSSDGVVFDAFSPKTLGCLHGACFVKACQTDDLYSLNCEGRPFEDRDSAIWMHSNAGLTFSLENLQNSLPADMTVSRFTAQCSMLLEMRDMHNANRQLAYPKVDVLVLVDGKVRFQRRELTPNNGIVPIDLEILPEDHYLTLVVTDSGSTDRDRMVFAKPLLHIVER